MFYFHSLLLLPHIPHVTSGHFPFRFFSLLVFYFRRIFKSNQKSGAIEREVEEGQNLKKNRIITLKKNKKKTKKTNTIIQMACFAIKCLRCCSCRLPLLLACYYYAAASKQQH